MQVKIILDEETSNLLRSIDKSLALLANREPSKILPNKDKPKAGIERLTVASPEVLAKYAIIDKMRESMGEQGLDIKDEDILL